MHPQVDQHVVDHFLLYKKTSNIHKKKQNKCRRFADTPAGRLQALLFSVGYLPRDDCRHLCGYFSGRFDSWRNRSRDHLRPKNERFFVNPAGTYLVVAGTLRGPLRALCIHFCCCQNLAAGPVRVPCGYFAGIFGEGRLEKNRALRVKRGGGV